MATWWLTAAPHGAQVLLVYDVLPVQIAAAKTSLLIPPLLALTYCLLGGIFPSLVEKVTT